MKENTNNISARIFITGRVQGVGFRYYVYKKITRNYSSCTGYVRNLRNGQVEVFLEAEKAVINSLLPDLNFGPSFSQVTNIEVEWGECSGNFQEFEINY